MVAEARRYRIIELLGKGGFGTVYRAELLGAGGFRKPVALKILNADMAGNEEIVCRLRDEARLLGLVRHPCIVHADALVQLDGRWTLVMEHVPGVGLNELLRLGPLPLRCAVEITGRVADALRAAHTATDGGRPMHLIHRDMKPGNIVIGPAGEVKLLDFGVARAEFDSREALTRSVILGSEIYMAPERWEQRELPAGDVFSLGEVLYECLVGANFGRTLPSPERHEARIEAALERIATPAAGGVVPPDDLLDLLAAMLAYDPDARPKAKDIEVFCRDLVATLPGPWLRDWAERKIPEALAARPPQSGDPLSGVTLVEPSGSMEVVTGGMPAAPEPVPPAPRTRPWLVPVAFAVGLAIVVGVGAAVVLGLRQDKDVSVAPTLVEPVVEPAAPVEPAVAPLPTPIEPVVETPPVVQPAVPRPAPRAPPEVVAPAPTPPAAGRVVLEGDIEELRLVSAAGRFGPGEVPAGSYEVQARFPGRGLLPVGQAQVRAGQTTTVSCNASFAMCKVSP